MNREMLPITQWAYQGVWGILTTWFKVPQEPPTLPARPGEPVESFRPAEGFLELLKLKYWLGLALGFLPALAGWLALLIFVPIAGIALLPFILIFAFIYVILGYLALHLRYDTTWYVMTDRSIRLRRGIWVIHETTITFENVQNVSVKQGPIQRYFGISDVIVDTAGGGRSAQGQEGGENMGAHRGLIEGIANAHELRDKLLLKLRSARTSGLGDDESVVPQATLWSEEHVLALREIRDAARLLSASDPTD